jgi:16S rRNA (cytosine967-C5)-methyltransferase
MRFGGRLAAAIEVLADIDARRRPVSDALKDWGLSHRFAGSGDRAVIGNIVYDALRWRSSTAWVMDEDSPRAIVLGTVAMRWGLGSALLGDQIAGDEHAPAPLTTDENARIDAADLSAAPGHVRADVPEWVAAKLERVFGDAWIAEGATLATRPALDMRINRLKAKREKVKAALAKFGAAETIYSPDGLRIPATTGEGRHPNVQVEPGFQKGWFEVQDEGSQLAALLAGAEPGKQVLDLCAGAGGKTLALAAIMGGKGRIVATDSDRARLAPIFDRVKRAAAHNVEVRAAGQPLADLAGRMDTVLVDAPCTGSGVWRRRPDAKWRLTERALANRLGEQSEILAGAAAYVKPGGRLTYVTCSLLPEENDDQLAAFAEGHPDFAIVAPSDILNGSDAAAGLARAALIGSRGIVLSPLRTGTDGFFVGALRRLN